jgi:hypothetical protein
MLPGIKRLLPVPPAPRPQGPDIERQEPTRQVRRRRPGLQALAEQAVDRLRRGLPEIAPVALAAGGLTALPRREGPTALKMLLSTPKIPK